MNHRFVFEAVDRTFHDIVCKVDPSAWNKPFGGKTILLGGDFRQILPVLPKKGRKDIVMASIKRSKLWQQFKVIKLTENMRLQKDVPQVTLNGEKTDFAQWLLDIGEGRTKNHNLDGVKDSTWIEIPKELLLQTNINAVKMIIQSIYADLKDNYHDSNYLQDRAVLTPTNEDVHKLNSEILNSLPGESKVYKSSDSICISSINFEDQELMYPIEFLNSLNFNGIPDHELELKVGAPIILLRNINLIKGLCNGTRLIITQLSKWVIEGRIITGNNVGNKAFIPRIIMTPNDSTLPFVFKRRQFPIALCYAMTINKSQGQTLKQVGIYLPSPVFSHGQLYAALSRVTTPTGLRIVTDEEDPKFNGYTKNIVYHEIFNVM